MRVLCVCKIDECKTDSAASVLWYPKYASMMVVYINIISCIDYNEYLGILHFCFAMYVKPFFIAQILKHLCLHTCSNVTEQFSKLGYRSMNKMEWYVRSTSVEMKRLQMTSFFLHLCRSARARESEDVIKYSPIVQAG